MGGWVKVGNCGTLTVRERTGERGGWVGGVGSVRALPKARVSEMYVEGRLIDWLIG